MSYCCPSVLSLLSLLSVVGSDTVLSDDFRINPKVVVGSFNAGMMENLAFRGKSRWFGRNNVLTSLLILIVMGPVHVMLILGCGHDSGVMLMSAGLLIVVMLSHS